jgi:hypothetical protein
LMHSGTLLIQGHVISQSAARERDCFCSFSFNV